MLHTNNSREFSMSRKRKVSEPVDVQSNAVSGNELDHSKMETANITLKEAKKLEEEMEITIEEMKSSNFYCRACNQLQNDIALQEKFKCVLGKHPAMTMVIYCLGSLEFSYTSQYQLALAILLQRDFSHWIGEIEVYDPLFSPVDVIVFEKFGCKVLTVNEHCRREVGKPTLFFIPCPFYHLLANLLETNWCPSRIKQMILLTESFIDLCAVELNEDDEDEWKEYIIRIKRYIEALQRNTNEVRLPAKYSHQYSESVHVCDYSWHFFDVKPKVNMDLLLPENPSVERRFEHGQKYDRQSSGLTDYKDLGRYAKTVYLDCLAGKSNDFKKWIYFSVSRDPCEFRWKSNAPPANFVKLNISGKRLDENGPAGYAGIFRDETNEHVGIYYGRTEEAETDSIHAAVEALRKGISCLKDMPFIKNLIVEGDDLQLIRWMRCYPEPPDYIQSACNEVADCIPKGKRCLIYHVCKEANRAAVKLAKEGAMLDEPHLWIADKS